MESEVSTKFFFKTIKVVKILNTLSGYHSEKVTVSQEIVIEPLFLNIYINKMNETQPEQ